MSENVLSVNPLLCPLCLQSNKCVNLGAADTEKTCWCNDQGIRFPKELLDHVAEEKKGKACICQKCAQQFQLESGVNQFTPNTD